MALADLDQERIEELPAGAKEHVHLAPDRDLSASSQFTVVGRLDAKGTGEYHSGFKARQCARKVARSE
jgi:hypothetical protein